MTIQRSVARFAGVAGIVAALALISATPASAHVTVTPTVTSAGSYTVLTFSNGHGCEGSPTTKITISVPDGVNAVTPTRQPFYEASKQFEDLEPAVKDAHGNELTERVATVTYAATTALPDGYRDAFQVQLQIPEDMAGETLAFPVVQTCAEGQTAWTEIPSSGQSADDLEHPAPSFVVTASEDGARGGAADRSAEAEEDDTDGGSTVGVVGVVLGALGLLVAGFALVRTRSS
ncbi:MULTISPECIES: YcnI family copper-binding membrane protein [unclassified Nocardioides]|uniref:YcnI family copper-binding membrane protein n=1 Tax=unclassified Nocardioides TaxID=2615069 RepID=UPI0006F8C511|nr:MULTISPECIES: YcnI family protein [unclassified Nocardioides]KRA39086.1 hypothetical protein ASD81_11085 [Nocardioides sp. Root614]KRA93045.1 hypothetical protein ASD84_11350 [Nocardioides sp. Root682]